MVGSEIIRTRDGNKLSLAVYRPEKENNSILVIGPSAFCTQELYHAFALYLVNLQYTVVTFNYRGTNQPARQLRRNGARLHQWASQDLDAVLLFAKNMHTEKELILLAHGISGELSGLAAASQYINRLVLINAALSCAMLWPLTGRIRKALVKLMIPALHFCFGYFPAIKWLSLPRLPKGVMTEWANWCNHTNGVFDVFPDNNYRRLQVPILSLTFADDWNAPRRAVVSLHNHFSSASIHWLHTDPRADGLPSIGHNGFFQEREQPILWKKLHDWLREQPAGNGAVYPYHARS